MPSRRVFEKKRSSGSVTLDSPLAMHHNQSFGWASHTWLSVTAPATAPAELQPSRAPAQLQQRTKAALTTRFRPAVPRPHFQLSQLSSPVFSGAAGIEVTASGGLGRIGWRPWPETRDDNVGGLTVQEGCMQAAAWGQLNARGSDTRAQADGRGMPSTTGLRMGKGELVGLCAKFNSL